MRVVRALRAELGTDHGTVERVAGQPDRGTLSVRLGAEGHQGGDPDARTSHRPATPAPAH